MRSGTATNPWYHIYWGDYAMWSLTPMQRHALQIGQITPREARMLVNLALFVGPRLLP